MICKKLKVFRNLFFELFKFVLYLDSFKTGQLTEAHLNDCLRLNLIKAETLHKSLFALCHAL